MLGDSATGKTGESKAHRLPFAPLNFARASWSDFQSFILTKKKIIQFPITSALVNQFMTSEYMHTYDASLDDEFGEKTVSILLDGEESEMIFIDHPASEMSVSFDCKVSSRNQSSQFAISRLYNRLKTHCRPTSHTPASSSTPSSRGAPCGVLKRY